MTEAFRPDGLSFTDAQLQHLKDEYHLAYEPSWEEMKALLRRLEAAERYAWAQDPENGTIDKDFISASKKAWKAARGIE